MRELYKVIPIEQVKKWAKKNLSSKQLQEGIRYAKLLAHYPLNIDLEIEPCGEGYELRIGTPVIGKQGWLRAIFFVEQKNRRIFIVDLFWKKENAISQADHIRI